MTNELIERVEALSGPDSGLDIEIGEATGLSKMQLYTASIDAAMTLVPEGWRVRDFGDWEDRWLITLMNEETCEEVFAQAGRGQPAIALCIAALRARSADNG